MLYRRVSFSSGGGSIWPAAVFFGALFVLAGIVIALYPRILVALVSGLVIFVGVSLIGAGLAMRRAERLTRHHAADDYDIIDP